MSYLPNATRSATMSIPSRSSSTSPATRSMPMPIGSHASSVDALSDALHSSLAVSSQHSSTQHYQSAARKPSVGSATAYLSDADLFGDDEVAYMKEAPAPPRSAFAWQQQQQQQPALPRLPPLKPRTCSTNSKKRRTSSAASKASTASKG